MSQRDNQDGRRGSEKRRNMWTSPASGPSPGLEALSRLKGDEDVSLNEEERAEIRERVSAFERQAPSENGQNFLP